VVARAFAAAGGSVAPADAVEELLPSPAEAEVLLASIDP